MKPVAILAIMLIIFFATSILSFVSYDAISHANPFDRYSLMISVLVAFMLGIAFWYLQKIDSDKMQQILAMQHGIIEKINARENARKNFWVSTARAQLQSLIDHHEMIIEYYQKLLSSGVSDEDEEEMHHHFRFAEYEAESQVVPRLMMALSQVGDLLNDPSLLNDITIDDLEENHKERLTRYIVHADVGHSKEAMIESISKIREKIQQIQTLISRLDKELIAKPQ